MDIDHPQHHDRLDTSSASIDNTTLTTIEDDTSVSTVLHDIIKHITSTKSILLIGPNFSQETVYRFLLQLVERVAEKEKEQGSEKKKKGRVVGIGEGGIVRVGKGRGERVLRLRMKKEEAVDGGMSKGRIVGEGVVAKERGGWCCINGGKEEKGARSVGDGEVLSDGKTVLVRVDCGRGWLMVFTIVATWEMEKGGEGVGVKFSVEDFSMTKVLDGEVGDDGENVKAENVFLTEWTMKIKGSVGKKGMEVAKYWPFGEHESVRVAGERETGKNMNLNLDLGEGPKIGGGVGLEDTKTWQINTGYQLFDTGAARGSEKGVVYLQWNSSAWCRSQARGEYNVDKSLAKYLLGDEIPSAVGIPLKDGKEVGAFFRIPAKSFKVAHFEISVAGKFRKPTKVRMYKGAQTVKDIPASKFKFSLIGDGKGGGASSGSIEAKFKELQARSTY